MTDELDAEMLMLQTIYQQLRSFPDLETRGRILDYLVIRNDAERRERFMTTQTAAGAVNPDALAMRKPS